MDKPQQPIVRIPPSYGRRCCCCPLSLTLSTISTSRSPAVSSPLQSSVIFIFQLVKSTKQHTRQLLLDYLCLTIIHLTHSDVCHAMGHGSLITADWLPCWKRLNIAKQGLITPRQYTETFKAQLFRLVAARLSSNYVVQFCTHRQNYPMLGPVSTEVGDRIWVQFPVRDIYLGMWPATQVNSAWLSLRG